ncbi:helix-turn-helix transcriptional regulator [Actinoplanes sp. NPDC049802]|uniref:helix-turn-helix transcriptional regulator n=1 Tax=Actinoplanes sp. NPDC049802 TaxID=3154742 RepID=UPI0033CB1AC9
MYSKFHFTRIFQRVTGLTPGRFLSAVRLQKAKQFLTSTSLTVTDISHMVGYTSVGTFSSRFAYSVGVPPRTYRRLGGVRPWTSFADSRSSGGPRAAGQTRASLRGDVSFTETAASGPVFIGLFPGRVPEGEPARCIVVPRPGPYVLDDIPPGSWHVTACSPQHTPGRPAAGRLAAVDGFGLTADDQRMAISHLGPVTVHAGTTRIADLQLRPMRPLDPPVLLALPEMRPEMAVAAPQQAA